MTRGLAAGGAAGRAAVVAEYAAGGYRAAPGPSLRYSVPGQAPVQVPLKLPYGPHKFMQPWRPANPQDFFAKWREASAQHSEAKVVTAAPAIAAANSSSVHRSKVSGDR